MKKLKKIAFVIIFLSLVIFIINFLSNPETNMANADQILKNEIGSNKSPSVQYFIFDQDNIIHSFQMGMADISAQKKTDTNTQYTAFSVTKTFTALAILQLAERGMLELDKPVIQYLPNFPYGSKITVKQLLTHSAGIPNPIPLGWIHLQSEHRAFDRNSFFKQIFERNRTVKSKPNEKFAYSNLGYVTLGQLIEKITETTYEVYVTENILQKLPVGQEDMTFYIDDHSTHAKGYHKILSFSNLILGLLIDKSKFMGGSEGSWRSFKNYYVNGASYGGLIGKPIAFVKYIQELLKSNNSLLSDEYKQMLFQVNENNQGKSTGMCLAWFAGKLNGHKYFAHAGGGGGYYCEVRIYPDIKMGSVIFFNRTGMTDERYLDKLDDHYLTIKL